MKSPYPKYVTNSSIEFIINSVKILVIYKQNFSDLCSNFQVVKSLLTLIIVNLYKGLIILFELLN